MSDSTCQEATFKAIYLATIKRLRNFLYYKCGDWQRAEDLAQEAFGKLWENCQKVPVEKAKSFLYTVANNRFLNQQAHQKVVLKFEQRGHSQRSNEDPQFLLEQEEFRQRLVEAINQLPDTQRTVFLMSRVDGLTYKEIAERLELSVKAIEKRMHKALSSLKKIAQKE
ncbi:MAG: RNA polymerase sigma factor [Bacteroidota bacterium]